MKHFALITALALSLFLFALRAFAQAVDTENTETSLDASRSVPPAPGPIEPLSTQADAQYSTTPVNNSAPPQYAGDKYHSNLFSKGRVRVAITGGWGYMFNNNYLILGGGAGYYVLDGLEFGASIDAWLIGSPAQLHVAPEVRYVLPVESPVRPYIGAFFKHYFMGSANGIDYSDLNTVGARVGVLFTPGGPLFFGLGAVGEVFVTCNQSQYNCSPYIYPELSVGAIF